MINAKPLELFHYSSDRPVDFLDAVAVAAVLGCAMELWVNIRDFLAARQMVGEVEEERFVSVLSYESSCFFHISPR